MTSISSVSAAFTGRDSGNRLYGPVPEVTEQSGYVEEHPKRVGFFTDTSVCIGCKACEVACKEWNTLPMDDSHGVRDALGDLRDVLRQHRPAGRQLLAARGVRRADPHR